MNHSCFTEEFNSSFSTSVLKALSFEAIYLDKLTETSKYTENIFYSDFNEDFLSDGKKK